MVWFGFKAKKLNHSKLNCAHSSCLDAMDINNNTSMNHPYNKIECHLLDIDSTCMKYAHNKMDSHFLEMH